jgi:AraC family transcriptional regulator
VIAEEWGTDPGTVEIIDRFLVRDPIVESVLTRLALEARHQSTLGQLYAESACEFLAHHIVRAHSSLTAPPPRRSGGLPAWRLTRVLEYIEENLAQSLTLYQLAEVAAVSPRHFERAFRQALGVAPYGYVLGKRVTTAQHLILGKPRLSIEEIAERVGFSSASHLASAFRRHTGLSPTAFRALHSR